MAAAMCAWPAMAGRLGASRAADVATQSFLQRRVLQSDCLTCSALSNCVRAVCLYSDGNATNYVSLDFSGCKNNSLSWFCCQFGTCSTTACNGVASTSTCNNVVKATVAVPAGAASVTLQVHDGRITGNFKCTTATPCCGGDGGACGTGSTSSVCGGVVVPISGVSGLVFVIPSLSYCRHASALSLCPALPIFALPLSHMSCSWPDAPCLASGLLSWSPEPSACLVEPRPGAFDSPGSYVPAFSGVYGCFLNAAPGAVAALACYDSPQLINLTQYLLVTVLPTPSDNYACLTCGFYNVAPLAATSSANCDCNDTAWAFPTPAQLGAAQAGNSTSEIRLNVTDPGFGNGVFWNPRQPTSSAWGGYFRIAPPASPNAVLTLAVCAGCGQNQPDKGYYLSTGFTITFTNFTKGNGSITIKALAPGASAEVDKLQIYLSFVAPPNLNPGQFQTFTTTSPTVTPTNPLNAFPAGPFTAAARANVTYTTSSGSTATVPASVDPSQGLFFALHLDGIRSFTVLNDTSLVDELNKDATRRRYGESFGYWEDDSIARGTWRGGNVGDTRAAVTPFLAHKHFGETYKWMLYGDDDTLFYMSGVIKLLEQFDPEQPLAITDNIWSQPNHTFTPRPACPFCTRALACGTYAPRYHCNASHEEALRERFGPRLFTFPLGRQDQGQENGQDAAREDVDSAEARESKRPSQQRYIDGTPWLSAALGLDLSRAGQEGGEAAREAREALWLPFPYCARHEERLHAKPAQSCLVSISGHGGTGIIFSVGLMRLIAPEDAIAFITKQTGCGGGDCLLGRALWFRMGIGYTDPGTPLQHGASRYERYARFVDSNTQGKKVRGGWGGKGAGVGADPTI
eukprot:XP_001699035.1 predicted protein [Chlamydomonas reinhardtii]